MGDLLKAFERFLFRDLSFLLGGSVLLYSIVNRFGNQPKDIHAYDYFFWAGISYIIGYCVQELFTLIGIVRTKAGLKPNWIGRLLYCLFEGKCPTEIEEKTYKEAKLWLYKKAPERFRYDHERTESLKQVGTAAGPSFLLAGVLLWSVGGTAVEPSFFLASVLLWSEVGKGLVGLGIILILLGWLKVTQQRQNLIDLYNDLYGKDN